MRKSEIREKLSQISDYHYPDTDTLIGVDKHKTQWRSKLDNWRVHIQLFMFCTINFF